MPKITALPPATQANDADLLVIDQQNVTKNLLYSLLTYNSGGASRLLSSKLGDVISVKDPPFLVKWDGVADDTVPTQAALNSLTNGGTLILPPGLGKITSTLSLPTGVPFIQIIGSNMALGVGSTGFASGFNFVSSTAAAPCLEYAGTINAEAHTCLVLTGFGINLNSNNTYGIHLKGVSDARVERVFFSGSLGGTNRGVYCEDVISSRIAYCIMRQLQYGIVSDQTFNNDVIEGNNIYDIDQYAVLLRGNVGGADGGLQSRIAGNSFIRISGSATYLGALRMVAPIHGVTFDNNTVEVMQGDAVLGSRTDPIAGGGSGNIDNFVERENTYIATVGYCANIDFGQECHLGPSLNSAPAGPQAAMYKFGANGVAPNWLHEGSQPGGKLLIEEANVGGTVIEQNSFVNTTKTISAATYTVLSTDSFLIANFAGTVTVTLPDPTKVQRVPLRIRTLTNNTVISASSNVVPLAGGAAGTAILAATAGKWATLVTDGTNWEISEGN